MPAHPRHAGELRAVRHFVDRDPQAEVARPEREALLQREDVRPDVVHGVAARPCRERAGRTGRALAATGSRAARPSRWRRRAGRSARADCARGASPSRCISGSSIRRIDTMLASTQPAAVEHADATWSGVCKPGEFARRPLRRAPVSVVEVVVQRRAEVRVGERRRARRRTARPAAPLPSRPDREPSGGASGDVTGPHPARGRPFTSSLPTLFQYCREQVEHHQPEDRARAAGRPRRTRGSCRCGRPTA